MDKQKPVQNDALKLISSNFIQDNSTSYILQRNLQGLYLFGGSKFLPGNSESVSPCIVATTLSTSIVAHVSVGTRHCIIRTVRGSVFSWGTGHKGQLGLGTSIAYTREPRLILGIGDEVISSVASDTHSAALTAKGKVYVWGDGDYSGFPSLCNLFEPRHLPLPPPPYYTGVEEVHIIALSVADKRSAAVSKDGDIYMWGNGFSCSYSRVPKLVHRLPANDVIVEVGLTQYFGLALTDGGRVWIWGDISFTNDLLFRNGLGNPTLLRFSEISNSTIGTLVSRVVYVCSMSVGHKHALFLTSENEIYGYGDNSFGQCAKDPSNYPFMDKPQVVDCTMNGIQMCPKMVFAGARHSAFTTHNGNLCVWGSSDDHMLVYTWDIDKILSYNWDTKHQTSHYTRNPLLGCSVKSSMQSIVIKPAIVYSLLQSVITVGLGHDTTIVVVGPKSHELEIRNSSTQSTDQVDNTTSRRRRDVYAIQNPDNIINNDNQVDSESQKTRNMSQILPPQHTLSHPPVNPDTPVEETFKENDLELELFTLRSE